MNTTFVETIGKGAIRKEPDPRDYKLEALLGVGSLAPFDWEKGFSVEDKVGKLKVEHQGTSSSCVGQAWSKYQEVLDTLEGDKIDHSARDIYSRIFQEPGGAYIMDGAKLLVKRGVALERDVLSYIEGKPPTEAFMRLQEAPHELLSPSKSYATLTHNDIEWIAQMIRDNNGVVSGFVGDYAGWSQADIIPPKSQQWAHAVYLIGACMRNGKKAIKFINSWGENWGENGYGYFYADSLGELFDLWVLIDYINNMNKVLKTVDKQDNWVIKENRHRIPDYETFSYFEKLGFIGMPETVSEEELNKYAIGEPLPSIKLTRALEPIVRDIFLEE